MIDREKVIAALTACARGSVTCKQSGCPLWGEEDDCISKMARDALEMLKRQEPHLVVKEDFVNADKYGYLPVFVENRDGDMYWDCITDAALGDTVSRFWTAKPTDEQRKEMKWDD